MMSAKGAIAAGHVLTAQAGQRILQQGGNAFDAVLAAFLTACVVEPVLASLGGGGFMLAKPTAGDPTLYDFFVQSPRRKRPVVQLDFQPIWADFGKTKQEFHIGQGTVATPGCVRGLFDIHWDLGSIPLTEIAAPAVEHARDGVALNGLQAYIFSVVSPIYVHSAESRSIFCGSADRNEVLSECQVIYQPELADTIERLIAEGPELFYQGAIAREIVDRSQQHGGHLQLDDLAQYQVVKRSPLDFDYRGSHVLLNPPPSSGGILIAFALQLMKELDVAASQFGSHRHLQLLAEVLQLTGKARAETMAGSASGNKLLDEELLERYRKEVHHRTYTQRGTTHISVIDAQGNMASMTVSNGEGCGDVVSGTGIMLNNMLGEQDLNFQGFHLWDENQRMSSMMSPTMISAPDSTQIAMGSGGSNRIRTALLQVISNLIDFEMDVASAVNCPRIHLEGTKLSVEGGFRSDTIDRLVSAYPENEIWTERNLFFGGVHTVAVRNGRFTGAGDPRRDGVRLVVDANA